MKTATAGIFLLNIKKLNKFRKMKYEKTNNFKFIYCFMSYNFM